MLPAEIKVGYLFRYSYLWHRQHLQGLEEGGKDRPCLVLALVATSEDGIAIVRVLPVTRVPPGNSDDAIEIPPTVKRRLRLNDARSWIVLTESNRFAWPGPDIRPLDTDNGYYGPVPPALFAEIKHRFAELARRGVHDSAAHGLIWTRLNCAVAIPLI